MSRELTPTHTRRTLLKMGSVVVLSGLAGCGSNDSQISPEPNSTDNEQEDNTPESTPEPTPVGTAEPPTQEPVTIEDWLENVPTYDGEIVDREGENPEIVVGLGEAQRQAIRGFSEPAIRINTGETVTWVWTEESGLQNVVGVDLESRGGLFRSEETDDPTYSFSYTFEDPGTYYYHSERNSYRGMRGVVVVEEK